MDIITQNPYRYLGVYSNSPTKERIANKAKMNAFLKVGKHVSFPLDLSYILPDLDRSIETIANAESELTLPTDQIKFAQFWWMNVTSLDGIAFNHLKNGHTDTAKSIWEKKDNVSSLQNLFLLSIINDDWDSAIQYAENLYTYFSDDFIAKIIGKELPVSTPLWQILIDSLTQSGVNLLPFTDILNHTEWKNYIEDVTITPLIENINHAIDSAKSSKGNGPQARFKAGKKLIASTQKALMQIKSYLPTSDIRCQTISDKLATEILQCGIDYYNNSDDDDSATQAMKLQKYAYSIAVGAMTKDRCKKNVDILQKNINELPPLSVMTQYKIIQKELRQYRQLPDKICHAINLLNTTKPHLDKMKSIVGSTNKIYLKLSTQVVNYALHNVIEEVNALQNNPSFKIDMILNKEAALLSLKSTLQSAWEAIKIIDIFDMEMDFKTNRYNENRSTLLNMCNQIGISPKSSNESSSGCLIAFIAWIVIGCIAGGICAANDGDFAAGFCISGIIILVISRLFDNN